MTDTAALLVRFLRDHPRLLLLTGAGVSTGSGIPDYRDADGQWKRRPPITGQVFRADPLQRARYWARSMIGWPLLATARPNAAHLAIADLQAAGRVSHLVTQNVDGLHQAAGSTDVIDLHGRLDVLVCLACGERSPRNQFQQRLLAANPALGRWHRHRLARWRCRSRKRRLPAFHRAGLYQACDGMLKPDVVFFGENVPRERVDAVFAALAESDGLLVVGSSLMVYSGFRFAVAARERGLPVTVLTQGRTRADELADPEARSALRRAAAGRHSPAWRYRDRLKIAWAQAYQCGGISSRAVPRNTGSSAVARRSVIARSLRSSDVDQLLLAGDLGTECRQRVVGPREARFEFVDPGFERAIFGS